MPIAKTPKPPYYAVIFTNIIPSVTQDYIETGNLMEELAKKQEGFLGIESARDELGISVSYWKDLESIKQWKNQVDHIQAQKKGKKLWYKAYKTRISFVERDYGFEK